MKTKNKSVPFSRLTKSAQRVAIAKDIIAQVKAKKAIAKSQVFLKFDGVNSDDLPFVTSLSQIKKKAKTCSVCAIGAIMLSQLNVNGDVSIDDTCNYSDYDTGDFTVDARSDRYSNILSPYVTKYFSEQQLQMIEIAFELGDGAFAINEYIEGYENWIELANSNKISISEPEARQALKFGKRYKNINNRLIAIMNNIITNNGEFVP